ncbi:hypothetical protein M0813_13427 [Anaeramoeba flamelloides]|uniref:Uncharacterized protein n=1 Tax=Anaeramoeba flamelloides TaxID=1746091 RepID=A0ABQ8Z988_9EUKA|nr:hypothetical protein M0813_13427 [Anaeramoeba flamelloides]
MVNNFTKLRFKNITGYQHVPSDHTKKNYQQYGDNPKNLNQNMINNNQTQRGTRIMSLRPGIMIRFNDMKSIQNPVLTRESRKKPKNKVQTFQRTQQR